MSEEEVETVKVEVEITKPFHEALKDFVETSKLGYDGVGEFIAEAARAYIRKMR